MGPSAEQTTKLRERVYLAKPYDAAWRKEVNLMSPTSVEIAFYQHENNIELNELLRRK